MDLSGWEDGGINESYTFLSFGICVPSAAGYPNEGGCFGVVVRTDSHNSCLVIVYGFMRKY
jgi:hypothetical protein